MGIVALLVCIGSTALVSAATAPTLQLFEGGELTIIAGNTLQGTKRGLYDELRADAMFSTIKRISTKNGYKWDVKEAYDIMICESGGNPNAHNSEKHKGCSGSYGLFQIACLNYGGDYNDLYNPETNIETAYQIYKRAGGFKKDWTNCFR